MLLAVLLLPVACSREGGAPVVESGAGRRVAAAGPLGVVAACSACHLLPPPDALPNGSWGSVIDEMVALSALGDAAPLHPDDVAAAREYFGRLSPDVLAAASNGGEPDHDDTGTWRATHVTPPGLEQALVPAVAHITSARLLDATPEGEREEETEEVTFLVSELRSSSLLHLAFDTSDRQPLLYPMLRDLNYPAHVAVADVTADGRPDLLIAGMGSMQPSNAENGTVIVAMQQEERRFQRSTIAANLGRPADVAAADLDGDSDADIVIAAFGLHGPGKLAILEGQPVADQPGSSLRPLDERDGFTSLAIADMDGDARPDIVALLAQEHEQVIVFRNEGRLRFSPHVVWAAPHPSWALSHLHLADLNGDAAPDIVVTNGDSLDHNVVKPYSGVRWLENRGGLEFVLRHAGALPGASAAASADMDGDGDLDLVAAAFMPLSRPSQWMQQDLVSLVWLENRGPAPEGPWPRHVIERHAASHPAIAVADCDGDGLADIVAGNYVWIDKERGPLHRAPYVSIYTRAPP